MKRRKIPLSPLFQGWLPISGNYPFSFVLPFAATCEKIRLLLHTPILVRKYT
jgi:hypothetical protein